MAIELAIFNLKLTYNNIMHFHHNLTHRPNQNLVFTERHSDKYLETKLKIQIKNSLYGAYENSVTTFPVFINKIF